MTTGEPRAGPAGWGGRSEERPHCGTSLFQLIPTARRPLTNSVGRDPRHPIPALRVVVLHTPGARCPWRGGTAGDGLWAAGRHAACSWPGKASCLGKEGASVGWRF